MARIVVTAGKDYLDIDAYGGIVAYAELLQKLGTDAVATSSAPFNSSITSTLSALSTGFSRNKSINDNDQFALIDLSDPKFFDTFVVEDRVVTIVDHHAGFEEYWHQKIGSEAHIDFIGAACTLVFELWQKAGVLDAMTKESAILLAAGIIDNTLNFKANLTSKRDHQAYGLLKQHAKLANNWAEIYLMEYQTQIMQNFSHALQTDTKRITYPSYDFEIAIGQLAVLDAAALIGKYKSLAAKQLSELNDNWYLNVLDLEHGVSYFYTTDTVTQKLLSRLLGISFTNGIAIANRLWLRKEIYKKALHEKNRSK